MEAPVEIRYSGVILGRIDEMPSAGVVAPFFLPMREPMPVGTVLRLRLDDRETPVRVVRSIESADPNACGMQVCAVGESELVAFEFVPAPVAMLENPRTETATPLVEIDASKSAPVDNGVETPVEAAPAEPAVEAPPAEAAAPEPATAEVSAPASDAPAAAPDEAASVDAIGADFQAAVAAEVPPTSSADAQAVPEAVPVAVGSSMTGALENATESAATDSAAVTTEVAGDSSAASGAVGDLPPARPISGGSARRKTKRRK